MSLRIFGSGPSLELNSWQLRTGDRRLEGVSSQCACHSGSQARFLPTLHERHRQVWFDDLQLFVDGRPIADALGGIHPESFAQPVPRQQSSEILALRMARLVCSLRAGAPTALGGRS